MKHTIVFFQMLVLCAFLGAVPCNADVFRIAGIFEENLPHKKSATQEMLCMSQAVIDETKLKGMKIDFRVFENRRSAVQTKKIVDEIVKSKFDAVIGTRNSVEALVAAEPLNKHQIPFFVPNATHPDVTKDKPYVTRLASSDTHQAKALAEYTKRNYHPTHVLMIVNVTRSYSVFLAEEYANNLKIQDKSIKITRFDIFDGFDGYSELVNTIESGKPDLVFLPLINPRAGNIYNELSKRNMKIRLLGGDGIGGRESFFRLIGKTSPNIEFVFVKNWDQNLAGNERKRYLKLYEKSCGSYHHHTYFTVLGYDMTTLLLKTLERFPNARGIELINASKTLNYDGLLGKMDYDRSGETMKPLHFFAIKNNKVNYLKTYTPG